MYGYTQRLNLFCTAEDGRSRDFTNANSANTNVAACNCCRSCDAARISEPYDWPAIAVILLNLPMPENESKPPSPTPPQEGESINPPPISPDGGRMALLERARTFLMSPQVRAQDAAEQRAFLREKGLDEKEVTQVLSEVVRYELVFQCEVNANVLTGPENSHHLFPREHIQCLLLRTYQISSLQHFDCCCCLLAYLPSPSRCTSYVPLFLFNISVR